MLPKHEVRQRVRDTAAAVMASCVELCMDDANIQWMFGVLHATDGGELDLGMTLAQYRDAVLDWCAVLRTTRSYPHDRALVEAGRADGLD